MKQPAKGYPIVIGLVGKQGAGKTAVKDVLLSRIPDSYGEKFAGPIYGMHDAIKSIADVCDIPMPDKDRKLLQWIGTEWGRNTYGDDVWVKAFLANLDILEAVASCVVVDDVRFPNEAEAIENIGGILIKIDVSEEVRKKRIGDTWKSPLHSSETALDSKNDYTSVVDGTQSVEDIAEHILQLIKETYHEE